jgi:hypothetical protein
MDSAYGTGNRLEDLEDWELRLPVADFGVSLQG